MSDVYPAEPAAFVAALNARDPRRAAGIAIAMLRADVPLGRQWQAVARFAADAAEWGVAVEAARRFVLDDPLVIDRRLALGDALIQAGRLDEAITMLEPLAAQAGGHGAVRHMLGVALIERGRREAGVDHLMAALRARPNAGATWVALANAHRFADADPLIASLTAAVDGASGSDPANRAALAYAQGKMFDDLGEVDRAWAAFAAGAALVARQRPYDAGADRAAAMGGLAPPPGPAMTSAESAVPRAILVTGKPRSGTTLVEQILAAHSNVVGGGEINLLGRADTAAAAGPSGEYRKRFAAHYDRLLRIRASAEGRVVDKSLNTSRFAATVRAAMPEVPLIWLQRDALDTAWSSFRTWFADGLGWSFDLVAMARFHAVEDALHGHWQAHFGDRLMTLAYADLVDDPDRMIAAMLRHAGLADEPRVRDFHRSDRTVQTASVDQVRRPINREGMGSATPYRAHLAPYERAYEEARKALGLPV